MAVYVDQMLPCLPTAIWRWPESCHLFTGVNDSIQDLHQFAVDPGLKRAWFQGDQCCPITT